MKCKAWRASSLMLTSSCLTRSNSFLSNIGPLTTSSRSLSHKFRRRWKLSIRLHLDNMDSWSRWVLLFLKHPSIWVKTRTPQAMQLQLIQNCLRWTKIIDQTCLQTSISHARCPKLTMCFSRTKMIKMGLRQNEKTGLHMYTTFLIKIDMYTTFLIK